MPCRRPARRFRLGQPVASRSHFLSPAALAYAALSLAEMNRAPMATELLALLEKQDLDAVAKSAASDHPTELRALYAWPCKGRADLAQRKQLVEWLLAHRPDIAGARPGHRTAMLALTIGSLKPVPGRAYQLPVRERQAGALLEVDRPPHAGDRRAGRFAHTGQAADQFPDHRRGRYAYQ